MPKQSDMSSSKQEQHSTLPHWVPPGSVDLGSGSKLESHTDTAVGMTVEKARVIAVEPATGLEHGALWVETFQQSTCGSCEVKGACGQGVLGKWLGRGSHCIRVLCDKGQADLFAVGQWVEIGVPDGVVLKASLMMYILPLFGLLAGAIAFEGFFGGDLMSIVGGISGFISGLLMVRVYERNGLDCRQSQPQLLGLADSG